MKRFLTVLLAVFTSSLIACNVNSGEKNTGRQKDSPVSEETSNDSDEEDSLQIYTSFYPMFYFTKEIVGDTAEVKNIMPAGSSSHDYEPTAKDIAALHDADVLVYQGAGMEFWIDQVKDSLQAEGSNIHFIEAAKGIDDLLHSDTYALDSEEEHKEEADHTESDDHTEPEDHSESEDRASSADHTEPADHSESEDHQHGDEDHNHGAYDPHLWLGLSTAQELVANIAEDLSEIYPNHKTTYTSNAKKLITTLEALAEEYEAKFKEAGFDSFIVNHAAFGYLADEFDLQQVSISGVGTEQEPSPALLTDIIAYAKEHKISVIFYDKEGSDKVAKVLAGEIGGEVKPLDTIHSPTQEDLDSGVDYIEILKTNLDSLLSSAE